MALLACDVGFRSLGWTVIENKKIIACGAIVTEKSSKKSTRVSDDYYMRSCKLAADLKEIVEKYDIKGIVGELPSGGAQSAKAAVMMNMATAIVASVATILNLPCDWCTPTETKVAVCGYRSATKDEMMDMVRAKYPEAGHLFPEAKTYFEHIADAIGAYMALRNGNVVRMYG